MEGNMMAEWEERKIQKKFDLTSSLLAFAYEILRISSPCLGGEFWKKYTPFFVPFEGIFSSPKMILEF